MNKLLKRLIMALCVLFLFPWPAQAQLMLEGEFRPRTEYRNGYRILRTANTEPAFFVSQRSRLSLNYNTDLYEIKVSAQDVRIWGEVDQLQDNPNINIHEAWAELKVTDALDMKLGRQELVYDDQRLLGSVNWTQQARSHDALVLKYRDTKSSLKVDLGAAYNQEAEYILGNTYTINNYKILSYLWINKDIGPLNASFTGITDGFENGPRPADFRFTYGTQMNYKKKKLSLNGSLYLQNGSDMQRQNINAWMFAVKADYRLDALTLMAGMDYLSGGGVDDLNPRRKAFSTLYATNHKFYGHMDYFLSVPSDTRYGGLQDIYIGAIYSFNKRTRASATFHNFSLEESIALPSYSGIKLNKQLGTELDLNVSHTFSSDITFKAGYSMMVPSNTLERMRGEQAKAVQHWGWVMLSVTPTFFQN